MSTDQQKNAKLPFAFSKRHGILVTATEDQAKVVYCKKPDITVLQELRRHFELPLILESVDNETFGKLVVKHYETDSNTAMLMAEDLGESMDLNELMLELPKPEDLLEKQDDAPIIRLLNALLSEAIKEGASDVHIETFEDRIMVRFRVDGVLREILSPQRILAPLIISRIKVMAKLDIAEKRLPQDGRITLRIAGRAVDVRVSTMPTSYGERIVLRLLDKQTARLDLAQLGMDEKSLSIMKKLIAIPHGIILVTGPTGSGKTTTLYAALTSLNNQTRNILTVEDPIEFDLPGIGQTQVNYKVNMTFAKGLRAILRQDPDVVMVGEIRDLETAQIAIQASLTGHLVLSTLHTNSAIGAITRLNDMGIEPFLLSSSLIGVLAQRLMRLLCKHCKKASPATDYECQILGIKKSLPESPEEGNVFKKPGTSLCLPPHTSLEASFLKTFPSSGDSGRVIKDPPMLYRPVGCAHCRDSGYSGRSGVYELIAIDETLRDMIHARASELDLKKYARTLYPSIRQDGLNRILSGETSLEEILRVTSEE